MNISKAGIDLIKGEEGFRAVPYRDKAGNPTVGWGCTYYPGGVPVKMGDPEITEEQGTEYLMNALLATVNYLNNSVLTAHLKQQEFDALCSFTYQEGIGHFQTSTLRKLVNANPEDPNIADAFKMWNEETVDGKRVVSEGIVNRRLKEIQLYFS